MAHLAHPAKAALGQNLNLEFGTGDRRAHDWGVAGMPVGMRQWHGVHQDMPLQSKVVPPTRHILASPGAKGKVGFPALLASTAKIPNKMYIAQITCLPSIYCNAMPKTAMHFKAPQQLNVFFFIV